MYPSLLWEATPDTMPSHAGSWQLYRWVTHMHMWKRCSGRQWHSHLMGTQWNFESFSCRWCKTCMCVTFLLLPTWYTNFLFIHINYIKLNSSTCFERNPLVIRRSTMQIVHMQPLVSSLSASDRLVQPLRKDSPSLAVAQDGHLQRVMIPEAAYV